MAMYVAFHYRLPSDKNPGLQGCWKEFSSVDNAGAWLVTRSGKTETSPQGCSVFVFKDLNAVPDKTEDFEGYGGCPVSLQRSISSFINFCNRKKQMLKDASI